MISLEGVRKWRWDLIILGLATLLLVAATTHPSAYFVHFDTPTQNLAALEFSSGCWEYNTEKILPVLLQRGLFALFGTSTYTETIVLAIGHSVSIAVIYELARLTGKSVIAGSLAAPLALALPAFQFYGRI